jgi:hypothetical protein
LACIPSRFAWFASKSVSRTNQCASIDADFTCGTISLTVTAAEMRAMICEVASSLIANQSGVGRVMMLIYQVTAIQAIAAMFKQRRRSDASATRIRSRCRRRSADRRRHHPYDEQHYVIYLRLLDAETDGADWTEVARIVLHRDPVTEEIRTRRCWESHLARAQWMTKIGYRRILEQAAREHRPNLH